jgi:hypothetical protein
MLAFNVQEKCQMDYTRLCSPRPSFFLNQQSMTKPSDSFFIDFFVIDEVVDTNNPKPCGLLKRDMDDDDNFDDDDDDDDATYVRKDDDSDDADYKEDINENETDDGSTLLDIIQRMFSSDRSVVQSFPPFVQMQTTRNVELPAPAVFSRSLRQMEPLVPVDVFLGFGFDGDMCLFDNIDCVFF